MGFQTSSYQNKPTQLQRQLEFRILLIIIPYLSKNLISLEELRDGSGLVITKHHLSMAHSGKFE